MQRFEIRDQIGTLGVVLQAGMDHRRIRHHRARMRNDGITAPLVLFQCPCGTRPTSRSPHGQRPLSRTIFVLAAVSSMNTNRVETSMLCSRIQRRRDRATSARSCSAACRLFFKRDLVSGKKPPERGAATRDASLAHRDKHLVQRQIRLLRDQGEQPIRLLLQRRSTSATRYGRGASVVVPAPQPFDRRTGADFKMFRSLAPQSTALNSCDDPFTHLSRIRSWHCLDSKIESVQIDSALKSPLRSL